jgi:hypothetical protein
VTLADLLGQPVVLDDEHAEDAVPAVRDALMAPRRLSRVLFADGPPVAALPFDRAAAFTEDSWDEYQAGRLGGVIATLPALIRTAQAAEEEGGGTSAGVRWALSARVHHLAATALTKVGEADLAWTAAERSMQAADLADDPLVLASAARSGTHALLAVGRYDDAPELGEAAARWLAARRLHADPAALSLRGMLHLRMAVAAARRQDRALAMDLLARADEAAGLLGRDANYWKTGFGPTNVLLHRLSTSLDLGDVAFVADKGIRVDGHPLPAERRASHRIDVARALSYLARDDEAITLLLAAERDAPQLVRHDPAVREVVRAVHRRTPVTSGRSSAILALAERCRAVT